jgi:LCP family protein required for cell wall assembly
LARTNRFNVLLLGSDSRDDLAQGLSDISIVASVDPATKSAALISIPRDVCVGPSPVPAAAPEGDSPSPTPSPAPSPTAPVDPRTIDDPDDPCDTALDRINSAFGAGGEEYARRVYGQLLGLTIDYYAVVTFGEFEKLVDFVGGIDVWANQDHREGFLYPNGTVVLELEQGWNHLNGADALRYLRSRHMDTGGDISRTCRARHVLLELKSRLLRPEVLTVLPQLLATVSRLVETNVPVSDLPALLKLALQVKTEHVTNGSVSLDHGMLWWHTGRDGSSLLMPSLASIHWYVQEVLEGRAPPSRRYDGADETTPWPC